jgi:hypothetical protein
LAITLSFQKESRAPESLIRRPLGIPPDSRPAGYALDRLYPRQDAPTQLALDYSPEEDAGLTLASLPRLSSVDCASLIHSSATFSNVSLSSGLIALAAC